MLIQIGRVTMNISQQTLPNQVETNEKNNTQADVNKKVEEKIKLMTQVNKEMRQDFMQEISKLKHGLKETRKENMEMRENDEKEYGLLITWVRRIVISAFTCIAMYWIYETLVTYGEETVIRSTDIITNTRYTWPTLTLETYSCFNNTALREFQKTKNITLVDLTDWRQTVVFSRLLWIPCAMHGMY